MSTRTHLAAAQAVLSVTARDWGVADEMRCVGGAAAAVAPVRVRAALPALPGRAKLGQGTRALRTGSASGSDVTAEQWPYWPTYPGLAASWR